MNIYYKIKPLFDNSIEFANPLSHEEFTKNMPKLLKYHKALHLRPIQNNENVLTNFTEENYCQNVLDCKLKKFSYFGGAAPRTNISVPQGEDLIFTANEAPADQLIPFHHELAQSKNTPSYVSFYCKKSPETGGETPLIDSSLVYRYIHKKHPDFEIKLKALGVRYVRILPKENDLSSPLGRGWKSTYEVNSKKELEDKLSKMIGIEYLWINEENISIKSEVLPAIFYNDETKEHIFFNSLIAAFNGWQDKRNNRLKSICYGDDSVIEMKILEDITNFMNSNKVNWKWMEGDIIWIDNRQVMHSRNTYTGNRKVYASLWNRALSETNEPKMIGCINKLIDIPLSFGLWKVKNAKEVTYNAIKQGYRKLDCACDYGNESEVGEGIQQAIKEGICKRDDLHITSKLWNTYHNPEHVMLAFKKTLSDLKLEYLDLYLIHFPISLEYVPINKKYPPEWVNLDNKMILQKQDLSKTWKEMEKLYNQKLAKQIGVSNFNSSLLRQIINASEIVPHAIQIELHPYLIQDNMLKLCNEYNIEVIAYSPLGAKSYIELDMANKFQDLCIHKTIYNLALHYCKTPVQILLRWAIQRKTIPICKSSSIKHMKENIDIFDFSITKTDMNEIDKLNKNLRFNDPGKFCLEAFGTFCPIYD